MWQSGQISNGADEWGRAFSTYARTKEGGGIVYRGPTYAFIHRLDMTLAVAEALNPNKPINHHACRLHITNKDGNSKAYLRRMYKERQSECGHTQGDDFLYSLN